MEAGKTDGIFMRKGPWMAEEDEILMEYVKKHGPRNWSSIRSKGLLPRTGKSCRLRWVNKLKPNLKSGCKFSAEEERIVLELQAEFGNKWARIATHLPGRTDNDVKNFWSTRQKRLARILHASHQSAPQKNHEKMVTYSEMPSIEQTLRMNMNPFQEENLETRSFGPVYSTDLFNVLISPEAVNQSLVRIKDEKSDEELLFEEKKMISLEMPLQVSFPYLPQTSPEFPMFFENQDIPAVGMDDLLMFQGFSGVDEGSKFPSSLQVLGFNESHRLEIGKEDKDSNTPDSIFDDFPADMFDWEPLPDSSYL